VVQVKRTKLAEWLKKDYVQTIIMVAIVVVSVLTFWYGLRFAYRTEHPLLAVASGSMRPTLQVGDLILVQGGLNASKIKALPEPEGDIIVFRRSLGSGSLIVHRAINKENRSGTWYFETKGDNNTISDGWIPEQNVIGKVVGRVPLLGYIALFFEPFEVKVAFILLWIVLLIILEVLPPLTKKAKESQGETKPL